MSELVFPDTLKALAAPVGLGFLAALCVQLAKGYIKEKRLYNLVGIGVAMVVSVLVGIAQGPVTLEVGLVMFARGVCGGALATGGYETVKNVAGMLGWGTRTDPGI